MSQLLKKVIIIRSLDTTQDFIELTNLVAVKIHKEMIVEKFSDDFNSETIKKDILTFNNVYFLSYADQLNLSIIAKQLNDDDIDYKTISLRNAYNILLLSTNTNT